MTVFRTRLHNLYCWEPDKGYATFLQESEWIDFGDVKKLANGDNCRYVQNGPYRIKICIESPGGGGGAVGILKAGNNPIISLTAWNGTGRVFVNMDDVDILNMKDYTVLGSARGCFDIQW